MFQKVSINQHFLFEVWGDKGFIAPAPSAFNGTKVPWKATGTFGGKPFEVTISDEHVGKDQMGVEIPIPTKDNADFKITFTRGEESDSMEGKTKFL